MARQRKLHYAWIVAAVPFLTWLVAAGLRATPGVLIVPLETEFGWSRATISFAIGLNIFLYGLVGPFAAAMMDRFGLRRTMDAALAADPAVGSGGRHRKRSHRLGARRDRRGALVRRPARAGHRRFDGEHRDRPADLSASVGEPCRKLRLAHGIADRGRSRAGAGAGRRSADARPAARHRARTLRCGRQSPACRQRTR